MRQILLEFKLDKTPATLKSVLCFYFSQLEFYGVRVLGQDPVYLGPRSLCLFEVQVLSKIDNHGF